MVSNIQEVNDTFISKETTSQTYRLDFEAMRNEICAHDNYNPWNLVIQRELNGKNTIISIWFFNMKRSPYDRLIRHKSCLCAHRGMQQWGVNYCETYSPVVSLMFAESMLTLIILRALHTNYVGFSLGYTQSDVKS